MALVSGLGLYADFCLSALMMSINSHTGALVFFKNVFVLNVVCTIVVGVGSSI
jgi:hypothetical protein